MTTVKRTSNGRGLAREGSCLANATSLLASLQADLRATVSASKGTFCRLFLCPQCNPNSNTRLLGTIGSTLVSALGRTTVESLPTSDELNDIVVRLFRVAKASPLRDYYDDVSLRITRACPKGSLTWFMAQIVTQNLSDPSLQRLALVWNKVVGEVRHSWERGASLPGIITEAPDTRACLLHQKLQLLNYCIKRKSTPLSTVLF